MRACRQESLRLFDARKCRQLNLGPHRHMRYHSNSRETCRISEEITPKSRPRLRLVGLLKPADNGALQVAQNVPEKNLSMLATNKKGMPLASTCQRQKEKASLTALLTRWLPALCCRARSPPELSSDRSGNS